jgi:hypothetical protein
MPIPFFRATLADSGDATCQKLSPVTLRNANIFDYSVADKSVAAQIDATSECSLWRCSALQYVHHYSAVRVRVIAVHRARAHVQPLAHRLRLAQPDAMTRMDVTPRVHTGIQARDGAAAAG